MPDLEDRVAALEALGYPALPLAVAEEHGFMRDVKAEAIDGERPHARLTHLPTGVMVEAETRAEAVAKLGRALKRRGVPGAA